MTVTSAFGDVGVSVVPRVYGASELGVLSLTAPGEAHPRVEYVGGELFVGLDRAQDGAAITQGEAESWTQPFRDAVTAALTSSVAVPAPVEGVVVIEDEVVAASVLVQPSRVAAAALTGAPVLFALRRDRVAIVGADDESAVARVLDLAEELYDAGGPLVSAHPVALSENGWTPFAWRERFPSMELRFERVLRLFSVRAYEAQSVVLQRPDVHIADPKLRVLESGATATFATWPKGTATLLPVVDNVIIADSSSGTASLSVATLKQFLDAAGDAVVRTGLSPARYFVPGEPPRAAQAG
ncbi:hypothetical protein R8Z57_12155 [Microbacterium sp. M3]|uniref:Uncharacterized protein n=1 Tax=Microbacterium arthrosphaerae TaxID=792652 RepID=A0ABU4H2G0_9MICO|nr:MULTISPECIES: hypothetical protein [Microbacterium]MDW4573527.1 hypothetical protein [Microbacterium arthrosphaerae]MDW7607382.1 hypothetical protein [Microbacterium sp. M3]